MPFSRSAESVEKPAHRLSVSLNDEQYVHIADLARGDCMSIAWVVREALEGMLTERQPLLRQRRLQP